MDNPAMERQSQTLESENSTLRGEVDAYKNENLQLRNLYALKAEEVRKESQTELASSLRQKLLLQKALNEMENQRDEALVQLDDLLKRYNDLFAEMEVCRARVVAETFDATGKTTKLAKSRVLPSPSLNYNQQDVTKAKHDANEHRRYLSPASIQHPIGTKAGKVVRDSWITVGGPLASAESAYIRGDLQKALVCIDALLSETASSDTSFRSTEIPNRTNASSSTSISSNSNVAKPQRQSTNKFQQIQVLPLPTQIRAYLLQSRILHAARDHDRATAAVNKALAMASEHELSDLRKEAQFQKGILLCDNASSDDSDKKPVSGDSQLERNMDAGAGPDSAPHGYTGSELLHSKLLQARLAFSAAGSGTSRTANPNESLPNSQELVGWRSENNHKRSSSWFSSNFDTKTQSKQEEKRRSAYDDLISDWTARVENEIAWGGSKNWAAIHEEDQWSDNFDTQTGSGDSGEFGARELKAFEYFEGNSDAIEIV